VESPLRRAGLFIAAFWILLLLRPGPASAAGDDPFGDFDPYAAETLRDRKTPAMALSVVKDGRVVFARGYGVRKLGGGAAVAADTVFPIASITKAFNATALAILVDEGVTPRHLDGRVRRRHPRYGRPDGL
jgi:CubicO group peptidase (beta-lactamase class C family)